MSQPTPFPRPFALLAAAMLMSACATTTDAPSRQATDPAQRSSTEAAPDGMPVAPALPRDPEAAKARERAISEWPAARARITAALDPAPDVVVRQRPDGTLQLVLPGADAFAQDQSEPRKSLRAALDRVAAALADSPRTDILVLGHTDSMGSELHNLALSIRRAEAVAEYLRTRGIALARLTADGRGEAEPVANNAFEAGRAANRRVEIIVRPPQ